jgi:CarD family transcriptional regulator
MAQKALKKKPATANKTAAKKVVAKKVVAKKTAKKIVAKKPAAKKVVVKKIAIKKVGAKKPTAKKVTLKKGVSPKPVAKKATVAKAAPKKALAAKHVAPKAAKTIAKPVVQKQAAPKAVAPVPAKVAAPVKAVAAAKVSYKVGNHVVYPTHGVGRIMAEETQMIGDVELRMLVISFEKDKMTLRVPVHRATAAGLRPVSTTDQMKKVFNTLKGRARTSRGMWSRRAQEYEAKINSGNIHSIAEVVRDLHQNVDQSERSYSERMIYESALARLVGELAAAEATDHKTATDKLMKLLRAKVAANAALTKEAA